MSQLSIIGVSRTPFKKGHLKLNKNVSTDQKSFHSSNSRFCKEHKTPIFIFVCLSMFQFTDSAKLHFINWSLAFNSVIRTFNVLFGFFDQPKSSSQKFASCLYTPLWSLRACFDFFYVSESCSTMGRTI